MSDGLLANLTALISDPGAWLSLLVAGLVGLAGLVIGVAVGRRSGLLLPDATRGELLGIGLGLGLLALAAGYALVASRGATSFGPALIALGIAVALGRHRGRLPRPDRRSVMTALGALAFLVGAMVLYGITTSPSPRDGLQPIEFMDEAYYAVLSAQLGETGLESAYGPAGFDVLAGIPLRSWYHWGEIWLGALVLEFPGMSPMQARHLVVLPLVLLAVSCSVGSIVARLVTKPDRTEAFFLGAFGILTIGPIPFVFDEHFDWFARPLSFTVTQYGLAFVVVAIGIYVIVTRSARVSSSEGLGAATFAGLLFASHALVALTAAAGVLASGLVHWMRETGDEGRAWLRAVLPTFLSAAGVLAATLAWGTLSGHGIAGSASVVGIGQFDSTWQRAVVFACLGSGVLLAGILLSIWLRRAFPTLFALAIGSVVAVIAGALVWGARFADFNYFHAFYGAVSVLLTPVAVCGFVAGIMVARIQGRRTLATLGIILLMGQGTVGIVMTVQRLNEWGPGEFEPVPLPVLQYLRDLPPDSKVAYACHAVEEISPWDARLLSLTAHTGRIVVPMCFQADLFRPQLGLPLDPAIENPHFANAPQRALYPNVDARPSAADVRAFMDDYRIRYIFADEIHPNTLLPEARPIFSNGPVTIFEVS